MKDHLHVQLLTFKHPPPMSLSPLPISCLRLDIYPTIQSNKFTQPQSISLSLRISINRQPPPNQLLFDNLPASDLRLLIRYRDSLRSDLDVRQGLEVRRRGEDLDEFLGFRLGCPVEVLEDVVDGVEGW